MEGKRVLHLTVKKEWFQIMVTREKPFELRRKSKWIESRLFNKDGSLKPYDLISITNGYGKDKPNFVAEYQGFHDIPGGFWLFSNFSVLDVKESSYRIDFGKIISVSNYN